MGRLTERQEKVEAYIEKNRIHLSSYAIFDETKFTNQEQMQKEITNGKIVLTTSVGKFLMQKGRIDKYITETSYFPSGKECSKNKGEKKIAFDCFVFSGEQLKEFVEMINNTPKSKLVLLN